MDGSTKLRYLALNISRNLGVWYINASFVRSNHRLVIGYDWLIVGELVDFF